MTTPTDSTPVSPASPAQPPLGVRVSSTLCWLVGILTVAVAFAVGIPAVSEGLGLLYPAVSLVAGLGVCVAAFLIRRQKKLGVLVLALSWALPTAVMLLSHESPRGSAFLLAALLFAAANWKHFH